MATHHALFMPELLDQIFAHASAPPPQYHPTSGWHAFRPSHSQDLIHIRQVCTLWEACCRSHMFRCIHLAPPTALSLAKKWRTQMEVVGEKLEKLASAIEDGGPELGLGARIRILSVILSSTPSKGCLHPPRTGALAPIIERAKVMYRFAQLLSLTPHLTHLRIYGPDEAAWSQAGVEILTTAGLKVTHLMLRTDYTLTQQCLRLWASSAIELDADPLPLDLELREELPFRGLRMLRLSSDRPPQWLLRYMNQSCTKIVSVWIGSITQWPHGPNETQIQDIFSSVREVVIMNDTAFGFVEQSNRFLHSFQSLGTFLIAIKPANGRETKKLLAQTRLLLPILPQSVKILGLPAAVIELGIGITKTESILQLVPNTVTTLQILWRRGQKNLRDRTRLVETVAPQCKKEFVVGSWVLVRDFTLENRRNASLPFAALIIISIARALSGL